MHTEDSRTRVLTVAGFDPSGGAGLVADCKTFEQHRVYGLSVCTAITVQSEARVREVDWLTKHQIFSQLDLLLESCPVGYVKIGLIENLALLNRVVNHLASRRADVKIVWDPVLRSSSGFEFHSSLALEEVLAICSKLTLLTPNIDEAVKLAGMSDPVEAAGELASACPVLLKGGHAGGDADDLLIMGEKATTIPGERFDVEKHGSGCVLSAAILANLARGHDLSQSCRRAKRYTTEFLKSAKGLLGYHSDISIASDHTGSPAGESS